MWRIGVHFALVGALLGTCTAQAAEEFRVENRVYLGNSKKPEVVSTTLFTGDRTIDVLETPEEITVFDFRLKRVTLLNPRRREKAELDFATIHALTAELQRWSAKQSDPFLQFMADPEVEISHQPDKSQWTFDSRWMTYRLSTVPFENSAMADAYWRFSDWSCRLNTLLRPGSPPPFYRLTINDTLAQEELFPSEVVLRHRPRNLIEFLPHRRVVVRSEHVLVPGITTAERERLRQIEEFVQIFHAVRFDQYQKGVQ